MEKKHIIKFLNEKKRGVYTLLVEMYADVVMSMAITMALEIIREDLRKESGEQVDLNYNSLARAVTRFQKKSGAKDEMGLRKRDFKDAHKLAGMRTAPGKFKIG